MTGIHYKTLILIDKIYEYIKTSPRFQNEIKEKFGIDDVKLLKLYKYYLKPAGINRFYYPLGPSIKRPKSLRSFRIYYYTGQELRAWDRINEKFDLSGTGGSKWRDFARPLLGSRVKRKKSGGYIYIDREGYL